MLGLLADLENSLAGAKQSGVRECDRRMGSGPSEEEVQVEMCMTTVFHKIP